jgi:ankyrin repeat protein
MEELCLYAFDKVIEDRQPTDFKIRIIETCLKSGVDINRNNSEALLRAVEREDYQLTKYLLENGINVHADKDNAIIWASDMDNLEIVQLLVEYGADPHVGNGDTLMGACDNENLLMVKYFLELGVDCAYPNNKPIKMVFEFEGNIEIKRLLLENGADPNAMYDGTKYPKFKHTILERSAINGDFDSCQLLLAYGADLNLFYQIISEHLNNTEWLVADVGRGRAKREQMQKVVDLFMGYGIDLSVTMQYLS